MRWFMVVVGEPNRKSEESRDFRHRHLIPPGKRNTRTRPNLVDALTGKPLWNLHSSGQVSSNPISFHVDGHPHIAMAANRVIHVFGL